MFSYTLTIQSPVPLPEQHGRIALQVYPLANPNDPFPLPLVVPLDAVHVRAGNGLNDTRHSDVGPEDTMVYAPEYASHGLYRNRKLARASRHKLYMREEPCVHGHSAPFYTSSATCVACSGLRNAATCFANFAPRGKDLINNLRTTYPDVGLHRVHTSLYSRSRELTSTEHSALYGASTGEVYNAIRDLLPENVRIGADIQFLKRTDDSVSPDGTRTKGLTQAEMQRPSVPTPAPLPEAQAPSPAPALAPTPTTPPASVDLMPPTAGQALADTQVTRVVQRSDADLAPLPPTA